MVIVINLACCTWISLAPALQTAARKHVPPFPIASHLRPNLFVRIGPLHDLGHNNRGVVHFTTFADGSVHEVPTLSIRLGMRVLDNALRHLAQHQWRHWSEIGCLRRPEDLVADL